MDALELALEVAAVASYAGTVTVASLSRFSCPSRPVLGTCLGPTRAYDGLMSALEFRAFNN